MLSVDLILVVLGAHFLGDFVCQPEKWALAKSSSNRALTSHVLCYIGLVGFIVSWFLPSLHAAILWTAINGIAHWCTDYLTSRACKKLWATKQTHNFFVVIGLDQFMHYAFLFVTLAIFIR